MLGLGDLVHPQSLSDFLLTCQDNVSGKWQCRRCNGCTALPGRAEALIAGLLAISDGSVCVVNVSPPGSGMLSPSGYLLPPPPLYPSPLSPISSAPPFLIPLT